MQCEELKTQRQLVYQVLGMVTPINPNPNKQCAMRSLLGSISNDRMNIQLREDLQLQFGKIQAAYNLPDSDIDSVKNSMKVSTLFFII